jgi:hypothetical protein
MEGKMKNQFEITNAETMATLSKGFYMAVHQTLDHWDQIHTTLQKAVETADDFEHGEYTVIHVTPTGIEDVTKWAAHLWLEMELAKDNGMSTIPDFIEHHVPGAQDDLDEAIQDAFDDRAEHSTYHHGIGI